MAEKGSTSILERKLAANDADRGNARSALRALRLALARSAKDLYDLPLAVIGAKQARIEQDAAQGYLADDRLLVLLDGALGQAGAVCLDGSCVAALIQQQTMGRVTGTAMADRGFTGTDAALAEPLIEMLLSRAADLVDSPDDKRCLGGFRFGALVGDVRSLMLALESDRYRVFDLTVDIAEGAMQGAICLVLPDIPPAAGDDGDAAQDTGPRLDQGFGVMRADLTASIGRLHISLNKLAALRPGDVLPLTRERLEETQLVTITGEQIAAGRLGQINGLRAVRLNETKPLAEPGAMQTDSGFAAQVTESPRPEPLALDLPNDPMPGKDLANMAVIDNHDVPELTTKAEESPAITGEVSDPPAVITANDIQAQTEKDEDYIAKMTPEQAALEITQLAGLDADRGDG